MQARENTVKTVGMYKETMKLLLRCTNKRRLLHKEKIQVQQPLYG